MQIRYGVGSILNEGEHDRAFRLAAVPRPLGRLADELTTLVSPAPATLMKLFEEPDVQAVSDAKGIEMRTE